MRNNLDKRGLEEYGNIRRKTGKFLTKIGGLGRQRRLWWQLGLLGALQLDVRQVGVGHDDLRRETAVSTRMVPTYDVMVPPMTTETL